MGNKISGLNYAIDALPCVGTSYLCVSYRVRLGNKIRRNAPWLLRLMRIGVVIASYGLELCFGLGGCASLTDPAPEPPALTLNSAGRTIDGPIRTYTFEIYADGLVHYHGDIKVNVIGDRQAQITPQQVQQLVMTYKKIERLFKKMELLDKERYLRSIPRESPYSFRLQYQGENSKIRPGGFAHDLLANLNRVTPIKSWICFPEEDDFSCPMNSNKLSKYLFDK